MARLGNLAIALGILAVPLLGPGCATPTELSGVWVTERPAPLSKILVIGVARTESSRRTFEDRFVEALGERGTSAVASYTILPGEGRIEEPAIRSAVREHGFDGVIVTRLLRIDEETEYVPPTTRVAPGGYGGYGLYGYYGMAWSVETTPGYTITTQIVRLETNLYDVASDKLVWTAHSDTLNPDSPEDAIGSVTNAIIERLAEDGLL
jgi:hypothetical protein